MLISGERGVGKTTLCRRAVEWARENSKRVGGFLSVPVYGPSGDKIGIELESAATGERIPLAVVTDRDADVGVYKFDGEAIRRAVQWVVEAAGCDLIVIDEIGPLEIEKGGGWADVIPWLRRGDYRWALVVVRPALVRRLGEMLSGEEARCVGTVYVTLENRDALAEALRTYPERD